MSETKPGRAHLIAGGFPPGSLAGHDHDYARLRLLGLLAERDIPASVANDFADVEKWLPSSRLLITYVAGPYPDAGQCRRAPGLARSRRPLAGPARHQRRPRRAGGRHAPAPHRQDRAPRAPRVPLSDPSADPQDSRSRCATADHPLTRGLGATFEVEDEPYFIELHDPGSTTDLLTADYGPGATSPAIGTLYPTDTSLQADGRTRVLGYTREVGAGGGDLFCPRPLPQPGDPRRPAGRPRRHDARHLSRPVGNRRVHHLAAQRHRLARRRLIDGSFVPQFEAGRRARLSIQVRSTRPLCDRASSLRPLRVPVPGR